ncbi:UNVERIFIED_CONTAM: hypothetical protein Sradi_4930800 [Sesamum radiatum]|uniref:Uncharacterized protein n=1 Tax=Sesamum radiatum TaxID=300843 RepID=A0AAW2MH32_SESRA
MASADESVRFVREVLPNNNPLEANSRRTSSDPSILRGGRGRRLRQAAIAACRLLDEEDVRDEEGEGEGANEESDVDEGEGSFPEEECKEAPHSFMDWGSSNLRTTYIDRLI